jgi:hypothetical protein
MLAAIGSILSMVPTIASFFTKDKTIKKGVEIIRQVTGLKKSELTPENVALKLKDPSILAELKDREIKLAKLKNERLEGILADKHSARITSTDETDRFKKRMSVFIVFLLIAIIGYFCAAGWFHIKLSDAVDVISGFALRDILGRFKQIMDHWFGYHQDTKK